jgi:hypothetical protein
MRRFSMRRILRSPWGLSLALLGDTRPEKTIRLEGELVGVRKQLAAYLKELAV